MNEAIKKNNEIISKEELPLVLEPPEIQAILRIGRRATFELLKDPPFHVNHIGKNNMIKVPRDVFFRWLEGEKEQGS